MRLWLVLQNLQYKYIQQGSSIILLQIFHTYKHYNQYSTTVNIRLWAFFWGLDQLAGRKNRYSIPVLKFIEVLVYFAVLKWTFKNC